MKSKWIPAFAGMTESKLFTNRTTKQFAPFPASFEIIDKLKAKHDIEWEEIEEIFHNNPRLFLLTISDQYGELRYNALSRTDAGRYLIVFFIPVPPNLAKVISARDMTSKELRRYGRK